MQITENSTGYQAECFASSDKHAQRYCIVVVKATFDVTADGECRPGAQQIPFVYADEHYGDPGSTSIRYESDFAPVKPRADVLVNAAAVAPRGAPVSELLVGLEGPAIRKQALVTGDRVWQRSIRGIVPSDAEPFTTMPLLWDRSFGGSDDSHEETSKNGTEVRNLVGVGFHVNSSQHTIVGQRLPNVERPEHRMRFWSDKPQPIGFGSVGRGWQPRIRFAGTYDGRWMREKLPFLPDDFDDLYFQSAPADQQCAELPPGAVFACANMNATTQFVVRLPALDVPVRFRFDDRTEHARLAADTLILEPGASRIVMLGRTRVRLRRKIASLCEIQVGPRKRLSAVGKPHYASLGEAVTMLRRRRTP